MVPARLLTGLAFAVVLAGCSSSPQSPAPVGTAPSSSDSSLAPTETVEPDPGPRPKVGECHALSWAQAVAPQTRVDPVRCRAPHTAETFAVGRLDLDTGRLQVDSDRVQQRVQSACNERLPRHLGAAPRDVRLTMAQAVWFTPDVEQVEAGARWFRCDVVVVASQRALRRLPLSTKGLAGAPGIAMCAGAEPGTKAFARVACGSPHSWVAVSTVDLPGARLPGPARVQTRMDPVCRDAARARASDPLSFTWSQESPTREQWAAGQRYGICWAPA
ncbi:MAG: septum formation family protein [Nocardioides sp.]|nr:septum formation family protein [Nocardioides sp.]